MIYGVKEAFQVKVYYVLIAFVDYLLCFMKCMMATPMGAETIAVLGKLTLV
jgi:hypothetical protein